MVCAWGDIGRTAAGRAQSRFLEEHADEGIVRRLRTVRERGSFAGVHWAPRGRAEESNPRASHRPRQRFKALGVVTRRP